MIDRVSEELAWWRKATAHAGHHPQEAPETTDSAEDFKEYILRFWPRVPRQSARADAALLSQRAFWNRVALHRLRMNGERHWYLVAHTFDRGGRLLVLKVPPRNMSHAQRWEHARRQATFHDDAHGRYIPGIKVSDALLDRLLPHEHAEREGLLHGFPIIKLAPIPSRVCPNYASITDTSPIPDHPHGISACAAGGADLDRMAAEGALEGPLHYVPDNVCALGHSYVPPPKDKHRNLWDLTASGVNPNMYVPPCRMDMLPDTLQKQRPGCWQSGFDWTDSYWNWFRRQSDCDYIGVRHPVTGAYYRARKAVFGGADSAYVQGIMTVVLKRVINSEGLKYCTVGRAGDYSTFECTAVYVDDGHMVHDAALTEDEARDQLRSVVRVLADYGVRCKASKIIQPTKRKEFVGLEIDSVAQEVHITAARSAKYTAILDELIQCVEAQAAGGPEGAAPTSVPQVARRDFASLVGKLQFCAELVPGGQGHLTELYRARDDITGFDHRMRTAKGQWRRDVRISTPASTIATLRWWRDALSRPISRRYYLTARREEAGFWKGVTLDSDEYLDTHDKTSEGIPIVRMDAAGDAAAIAYRNRRIIYHFPPHQQKKKKSSNFRELYCFKMLVELAADEDEELAADAAEPFWLE